MKDYLECAKRKCDWIGEETELIRGTPYISRDIEMVDDVCPKCGHNEHYILRIMEAIVDAQKEAIRERLNGRLYNTKEKILEYYDHCCFYGKDVIQHTYKNHTQAFNRLAKKGALVKVHDGAGSFSRYTFPIAKLSLLIDEVTGIQE